MSTLQAFESAANTAGQSEQVNIEEAYEKLTVEPECYPFASLVHFLSFVVCIFPK